MKKKSKLIATLSSLGLSLAMMVFAVYAATSVTFKITTNINFEATKHVQATIVAKDTGKLASAPTNASYTIPAKTGANQTIGINPDGTDNGEVTDVEFVGAELDATNRYYGYQITITNNDDENKLPVTVTIPEHTGTGYTVTYKVNETKVNAGENVVEVLENKAGQNNVYVITCDVEVTDLAGNAVTIDKNHLNIEKILLGVEGEDGPVVDEPESVECKPIPEEALTLDTTTLGNGEAILTSIDDSFIEMAQYSAVPRSSTYTSKQLRYSIPSKVTKDEVEYTIVGIGNGSKAVLSSNGTEITELIIPDSVTEINNKAFSDCTGLTSIIIGNNVTRIGNYAFKKCSIISIVIPDSVTKIGNYAFEDCDYLLSVTIGSGATSISSSWLFNCSRIAEIINYATGLPSYLFDEAIETHKGETRITKDEQFYYYTHTNNEKYVLMLADKSLTSVTIPNDVKHIHDFAFSENTDLTSISISNSVTNIGRRAFEKCVGLTNIELPDSVLTADEGAFFGCTGLKSIDLSDNLENININMFYNCTNLTSIEIPDSVTQIFCNAFEGCTGLISADIPNSVTEIQEYAFQGCTSLKTIIIPNSVTVMGEYVFMGCVDLTIFCESSNDYDWSTTWNYTEYEWDPYDEYKTYYGNKWHIDETTGLPTPN